MMTWAVRLWPRSTWPYLEDIAVAEDGSVTVPLPSRVLAEQYLALVPVLAVMQPWGMEAHAGRAKLVMVMPVAEVEVN